MFEMTDLDADETMGWLIAKVQRKSEILSEKLRSEHQFQSSATERKVKYIRQDDCITSHCIYHPIQEKRKQNMLLSEEVKRQLPWSKTENKREPISANVN